MEIKIDLASCPPQSCNSDETLDISAENNILGQSQGTIPEPPSSGITKHSGETWSTEKNVSS